MKLRLFIDSIKFLDIKDNWRKENPELIDHLIKNFRKLSFWNKIQYIGKQGKKSLTKLDNITNNLLNSKDDLILSISKNNSETQEIDIMIDFTDYELRIVISVINKSLEEYSKNIIDDLICFTENLYNDYKNNAIIGPNINIGLSDIDYFRIKPLKRDLTFKLSNIVDFFDRKYHQISEDGRLNEIDKLCKSKIPEKVKKIINDNLVIFMFIDDLSNKNEIMEALTEHDRWLYKNIEMKIDSDFNELGDYREGYFNLKPYPPLTFYNSNLQKGFKSIVLNPDGSYDEEIFEMIMIWLKNKKLPDNTPLKTIDIILPNRESALKIYDKAKQIGVDKVLYVGKDKQYWNPFPSGLWIES